MGKIFISYSSLDINFVSKLSNDLQFKNLPVWLDVSRLNPPQLWDLEIQRAIKFCNCIIVVLTPNSVESPNVLDEISCALRHRKKIIPILLKACEIPLRLERMHFINFLHDYNEAFAKLLKNIKPSIKFSSKLPYKCLIGDDIEIYQEQIKEKMSDGLNNWKITKWGIGNLEKYGENLKCSDINDFIICIEDEFYELDTGYNNGEIMQKFILFLREDLYGSINNKNFEINAVEINYLDSSFNFIENVNNIKLLLKIESKGYLDCIVTGISKHVF